MNPDDWKGSEEGAAEDAEKSEDGETSGTDQTPSGPPKG
jgi:hypothetical protein